MHHFYFDASALVKRYTQETGSDKVNFLFDNIPLDRLMCSVLGAVEVFWVCVRKKNDRRIMVPDFAQAVVHLNREVIAEDSDFTAILIHKSLIWASMDLIETHSLNSVDSIVLRSALEVATLLRKAGDELVLVASDQRLLRAAQAEGILVFNPEIDSQEALEVWVFDTSGRDDDC